jgi:type IV pilus assembly protein PilW
MSTHIGPQRTRGRAVTTLPTRGVTLVELMVALAIGLVLALVVAVSMLSVGSQFRNVASSSAAQVNAQLALSLIDSHGRTAGAGLYANGQPLCLGFNAWRTAGVLSNGAPLLPARIVDGGAATDSDTITFTTSQAVGALSGMPVMNAMANSADAITVSAAGSISDGDVAIVGVPGSTTVPCTLFQVSGAPTASGACGGNATACNVLSRTASTGVNAPAGTFANEPRYGFVTAAGVQGPAMVMRLGPSFRQEAFAVMCNTLVQYNAFSDTPTCTSSPLAFAGGANALATDVVLMKAQYGISANASSDVVTNWVAASGGWANPSAADSQRIKAIRVVLIARAREPDPTLVTAASCTNASSVANVGPCNFDDAEAPVIDLSATSVPSGRTWRNYRYRVHQAVIPLRNVIWSN